MHWLIENKEWLFSGVLVVILGAGFSLANRLIVGRTSAKTLVHIAYWSATHVDEPYVFLKVVNMTRGRDIEITHVWWETQPQYHVINHERPLPIRLVPLETWETWVPLAEIANIDSKQIYRLGRVRLSSGETLKTKRNRDVPPFGAVAGESGR